MREDNETPPIASHDVFVKTIFRSAITVADPAGAADQGTDGSDGS